MPRTDIAAVILAGGKSSRMGSDKALLSRYGTRLVDYVAGIVREAGVETLYVSGNVEGYRAIHDTLPQKGPVGGICSCIEQLGLAHEWLLFLPVDMPLLTAKAIRLLLPKEGNRDACHYAGHPLPCLLHLSPEVRAYTQRIHQRLAREDECSVKEYLGGLKAEARLLPETLKPHLTNTNTPQQWREAMHESTHQ